MLRYQKGYICNGYTFVVNKEDVHNATDDMFVNATALLPDGWINVKEGVPNGLQALHVKRMKDEVDVVLLPHKDGSGYSFVNLTKGHICPCVFPTAESGLHDLYQRADVLRWQVTHWMPLPEPPKEDTNESH